MRSPLHTTPPLTPAAHTAAAREHAAAAPAARRAITAQRCHRLVTSQGHGAMFFVSVQILL